MEGNPGEFGEVAAFERQRRDDRERERKQLQNLGMAEDTINRILNSKRAATPPPKSNSNTPAAAAASTNEAPVTIRVTSDPADKFEDLVKSGIIDPTKVTRTALQNAASVSTLLLTSDALIAEKPKKDDHKHGGGGDADLY